MNSFLIAMNAVVPFFCYIAFGYLIQVLKLSTEDFMRKLNQLIFKAFFPITMFYNLYHRDEGATLQWKLVAVGVVSLLLLILLLLIIIPRLVPENKRRAVLIQAIFRSNFVLFATPLTENIFGSQGVAIASMMIAIVIPIYNVMAIVILEYYRGGKASGMVLLKKILTNPLIEGAIAGLLAALIGLKLPACVEKPVAQFANLTTPMALFVLGATLKFNSMRKDMKYILPSMGVKLLVLPAIALGISQAVHLAPVEQFVYFTMFSTPVAAASFPMAANMGGDGDLAGEIVVFSTVVSVFTLFIWIFFMNSVGILT